MSRTGANEVSAWLTSKRRSWRREFAWEFGLTTWRSRRLVSVGGRVRRKYDFCRQRQGPVVAGELSGTEHRQGFAHRRRDEIRFRKWRARRLGLVHSATDRRRARQTHRAGAKEFAVYARDASSHGNAERLHHPGQSWRPLF